MRLEIHNIIQSRWFPALFHEQNANLENLMHIVNLTNYDLLYSINHIENGLINSSIIYPFAKFKINRLKPDEYCTIGIYDGQNVNVKLKFTRYDITNKLLVIVSRQNPYIFETGFMGKLEKRSTSKYLQNGQIYNLDGPSFSTFEQPTIFRL